MAIVDADGNADVDAEMPMARFPNSLVDINVVVRLSEDHTLDFNSIETNCMFLLFKLLITIIS